VSDLSVKLEAPIRNVRVITHYGHVDAGAVAQAAAQRDEMRQTRQQMQSEIAKLASATAALQQAANELGKMRQQFLQDAEEQLVELALSIANKVLMQEIQAGRYQIAPIVKEALLSIPSQQDVVIRLNPDDIAGCEQAGLDQDIPNGGSLRFIADPEISRAECLVETPDGAVVSSIESHLAGVSQALGVGEAQA